MRGRGRYINNFYVERGPNEAYNEVRRLKIWHKFRAVWNSRGGRDGSAIYTDCSGNFSVLLMELIRFYAGKKGLLGFIELT